MKFLVPLALAALATPTATANENLQETLKSWQGDAPVQDRSIRLDPRNNIFKISQTLPNGMQLLIPRPEETENTDRYRRSLASQHRNLQDSGGVRVVAPELPEGAVLDNNMPTEFIIAGLEGATDVQLVFRKGGTDLEPVSLERFITDGVATVDIQLKPEEQEVSYSYKIVYTMGDETKTVDGGSFKYGTGERREGDVQTRSFGAGGDEASTCTLEECKEGSYENGGHILGASGRIFYRSFGKDYACSGTVIKDNKTGRSLVLTAAHCVFDDIDWNFGSNVIFIPERDSIDLTDMTAKDVHRECSKDICGCWSLSGGLVHDLWADTPWPARLAYDYGLYVVDDIGDHQGTSCGSDALDEAIDEMQFTVGVDLSYENIVGFGYSLIKKPDFRFCANTTEYNQPTTDVDTYWLPGCGLQGGASGGPWLMDYNEKTGSGKIVSVNSWSYSDYNGMGGPIIDASAARCLVNAARQVDFEQVMAEDEGDQGVFVNCYARPCISTQEEYESRRLEGTLHGRELCQVQN